MIKITIEEAWATMEACNDRAHSQAWDTWTAADEASDEGDEELAEELRESASAEQASYFNDELSVLSDEEFQAIEYYVKHDDSFRDQFECYGGFD